MMCLGPPSGERVVLGSLLFIQRAEEFKLAVVLAPTNLTTSIFFYPLSPIFSNLACFFNAPPHFISTTVTHLHVLED